MQSTKRKRSRHTQIAPDQLSRINQIVALASIEDDDDDDEGGCGGAAAAAAASSSSSSHHMYSDADMSGDDIGQRIRDQSLITRAPKYEYEQIVDYEPVAYTDASLWDAVNNEDKLIDGMIANWNRCMLCEIDQTKEEKEQWPALETLKATSDRNFHLMTPISLCKLLRKMYDETIRTGIDNEPPMRTQMFWEHIDKHAPTTMHNIEDSLRTFTDMIRVLRDGGIFEQHSGTKRMRVSKEPALMMLKIENARKHCMKLAGEMRASLNSR